MPAGVRSAQQDKEPSKDAFVSHSSQDGEFAQAVVRALETAGVRCWIAPRDIVPGHDWSASILQAIENCPLFILIFSERANASEQIAREVHIAQSMTSKVVIPLRVDAVRPSGALRYLLAGVQWLDVIGESDETKVGRLLEHVRQAVGPASSEFGAVTAPAPLPPNNLPAERTSFVGREPEIEAVLDAVRKHRLTSIVGTGGVGKTRLALHVGHLVLRDFPDGAWFIDLAPIVDGTLVTSTILDGLGFAAAAVGDDYSDALVRVLGSRRLLLILDNCEQVIEACSGIVERIGSQSNDSTILCTTRSALKSASEFVVRLGPLPVPSGADKIPTLEELNASPAVRLLLERASVVAPVTLTSAAGRTAVVDIARRLDGLPLAMELAAARTNVLSFEQIDASLNQRFKLLTSSKPASDGRQRTLLALIDWSYDLLDETERTLFRRLSVFRGGCTLESAFRVCGDSLGDQWQALDVLSSLTDKSLLTVTSEGGSKRYGQLETLREYSWQKVEVSNEGPALVAGLIEAFASIARASYDEWDIAPAPDWLSRLAPELDNFRAALTASFNEPNATATATSLAANLAPLFLRLSLLHEGIEWCRRALERFPAPAVAARTYYGLSSLLYNRGEFSGALTAAEKAVQLYGEFGDTRGRTRALSQVAQLLARQSRPREAREAADEALRSARALHDDRLLANVLQRCTAVLDRSEIELAREQYAECLRLFRSLGRHDETARALMWWARIEAEAECYERARDLSMEALEAGASGDYEVGLKSNITFFSLVLGNDSEAVQYARGSLRLAADTHNALMTAIVISYVAVLAQAHTSEVAVRLLGFSESRLRELGWRQSAVEKKIHADLQKALRSRFESAHFQRLVEQGAALTEEQAVARAFEVLCVSRG